MCYKKLLRKSAACILALAMVLTTLGSVGVLSVPAYADETDSSDSGETTVTLSVDPNATADGTTTFNTISAAVTYAVDTINPQSESARVTINVVPGDYEEQVRFLSAKYITLQQNPDTLDSGDVVNLHWYFCTGYSTKNVGLDGAYSETIDWSLDETWKGYNEGDTEYTAYKIGDYISGLTISYYDTNGVAHTETAQSTNLGSTRYYDQMAALVVDANSSNITIKDFNIVNSVPVMVTQGEKDARITPNVNSDGSVSLPNRANLVVCYESTSATTSDAIDNALALTKLLGKNYGL